MCLNTYFGWAYLDIVIVFEERLNFLLYAHSAISIFGCDFVHVCREDVLPS